jgi:hypothetical protein
MVVERPSYRKIVQDRVVTPAEFQEQAQQVAALFRQLEGLLSPEAKAVATDALCELAVLNALAARPQASA